MLSLWTCKKVDHEEEAHLIMLKKALMKSMTASGILILCCIWRQCIFLTGLTSWALWDIIPALFQEEDAKSRSVMWELETKMTKIPQEIFMAGLIQPFSSGFWLPLIHVCDCKSWVFFLNPSKASLNDNFITISLFSRAGSFAGDTDTSKANWCWNTAADMLWSIFCLSSLAVAAFTFRRWGAGLWVGQPGPAAAVSEWQQELRAAAAAALPGRLGTERSWQVLLPLLWGLKADPIYESMSSPCNVAVLQYEQLRKVILN